MTWPATAEELPLGVRNDTDAESGEPDPTGYAARGGTDPTGEGDHAERHNDLADAINRTWVELGTDPSGAQASVKARLEAMDLVLAAAGGGVTAAQAAIEAEVGARAAADTAEATARANAVTAEQDRQAGLGLPAKHYWGMSYPWYSFNSAVGVEKEQKTSKFYAHRNIVCRGLSFMLLGLATNEDEIAVGMRAANGTTLLATSGAKAGLIGPGKNLGRVDVDFTADLNLEAGNWYHPAFQYGVKGGTAATLGTWTAASGNNATAMDPATAITAANRASAGNTLTGFPFGSNPALGLSATAFVLIVRER